MQQDFQYRIIVMDATGSLRSAATVFANSPKHAKQLAQQVGLKRICSVQKTGVQFNPVAPRTVDGLPWQLAAVSPN